ncbi:GH13 alpha-amylase precursor [Mycena sanguinolenta]|nr:GH13 alpha-amylase precursor [Mycena sanguinolenta]
MLPSPLAILFTLVLLSPVFAASAADWASTSIYQLVTDRFATSNDSATACDTSQRTYCGGTWTGIANHLDYIQDMGFDAIWISPLSKNLDGTAYWLADLDTLNPHFGTAGDLKNLSDALHARGMYLMADVVVNHYAGNPRNTTPSALDLFDIDYPTFLPFGTESDFHRQCFITDYTNQTNVEQCWLGDEHLLLPDIDTEDEDVVDTLYQWIKATVAQYAIDGVRIDTVKHIRHDFWPGYAASAGVFTLGEVESGDPAYVASYLEVLDGVLDYPTYYKLIDAFASPAGNLSALSSAPTVPSSSSSSTSARPLLTASFLENHDQPRFPSLTPDIALRKNALVWPFVGDGMPVLYYGQEQGYEGGADPANREALWLSAYPNTKPGVAMVKTLNVVRKQAIKANESFLSTPARYIPQADSRTLMLAKPPLLTLLTNVGTNESTAQPAWSIPAGLYKPGTTLVDVLECRAVVVAGGGGETLVTAQGGMPQVLIPASMLSQGSGGACPALATGARSGTPGKRKRGEVVKALGVLGTLVGVVALL